MSQTTTIDQLIEKIMQAYTHFDDKRLDVQRQL